MPKELLITQRDGTEHTVLMDSKDFEYLKDYAISVRKSKQNYYAQITIAGTTYQLHRILLQAPDHLQVDHIDGKTLNCQRYNLRIATHAENQQNRHTTNSLSGIRGVTWNKTTQKWLARIYFNHKMHNLGSFEFKELAAEALANFRAKNLPFSIEARTKNETA